jgi:hypothetical protein
VAIGIDGLKLADEIVHYCDGKRESANELMDQLVATVRSWRFISILSDSAMVVSLFTI